MAGLNALSVHLLCALFHLDVELFDSLVPELCFGLHTHGDAFAAQARANGARAMISDRAPIADPGMPVVVVPDVRASYARAAARQFAPQPEITVGVTGTNGKSSIVSFVRQIWTASGFNAGQRISS